MSNSQAGYIFLNVNGIPVVNSSSCNDDNNNGYCDLEVSNCENYQCDWVAAFNPNNGVCVGATMWDLDNCNNNTCSINVGISSIATPDHLSIGIAPIFKVYDVSENIYYDATPSESIPALPLQIFLIDNLTVIP